MEADHITSNFLKTIFYCFTWSIFEYFAPLNTCLDKINVRLLNQDIKIKFNIHKSRESKIFRYWKRHIPNLSSSLIAWPKRGANRKNFSFFFFEKWKDGF